MAAFFRLWLALLYLVTAVTAIPPWRFQRRQGPPLPTEDPFYEVPSDFESAAPGTILKQREVPYPIAAFNRVPINIASAHHVMYRSADNFGNATVAVTTILVPHDANFKKVLSYQFAEDSSSPNCAPSYALQKDHEDLGTSTTQAEFLLVVAALSNGWVVTTPDFEGLEGAFLANRRAGYAVLDGIRATLSSTEFTGVSPDARVVLWGYSGGSLASGFAAELQPSYAPELNIVGAALGGTVPEIYPVLTLANKSKHSGLIPAGILGISYEYEDVWPILDEQLVPETRDDFLRAASQCLAENNRFYENKDILSYFKDRNIFEQSRFQEIVNENSMGHHTPTIPLLVYKADKDEVSAAQNTTELVAKYCAEGAIVRHNRDGTSDHASLAIIGAPDVLIWLNDRLNGKKNQTRCTEHWEFVSVLDPKALLVLSKTLLDELLALLGAEVRR
ncbi:hypothetical protein VTO42DRAFT_3982 [Malbranchea cinnamomea]|uniref:Extracellular triacylglycerol lipase n=1 Tax=Malbranchea cinnamomea TaxID=5041 RepID=A0A0F7KL65_MALCI|nr:extracellular triacylglycerol lipase [Malbranchea cinnamomea]